VAFPPLQFIVVVTAALAGQYWRLILATVPVTSTTFASVKLYDSPVPADTSVKKLLVVLVVLHV
jgi:hypothetical protein